MTSQALVTSFMVHPTQILGHLHTGQLLRVKADAGNAVIVCHPFHADLIGSGGAVGGVLDVDCRQVISIGGVSFECMNTTEERQVAYSIRNQWIKTTQRMILNYTPLVRSRVLLNLLIKYCSQESIDKITDEVLAQLIAVLPKNMKVVRESMRIAQEQKDTFSGSLVNPSAPKVTRSVVKLV